MIAICVDLRSQTLSRLRTSGFFAVNVLEASQEALSQCFAIPSAERSRSFCHVPYQVAVTGSPVLSGVLAFLDARIVAEYPGGDHTIILGQVEAMGTGSKAYHFNADGTEHGTVVAWRNGKGDQGHQPAPSIQTPLLYYQGQYRHLAWKDELTSLAASFSQDVKEELASLSKSFTPEASKMITSQEK